MLNPINTPNLDSQGIGAGIREIFRSHYGTRARIYRAPGRINLIGEHTDYNDGFVMPAAISGIKGVRISGTDNGLVCHHCAVENENADLTAFPDLTPTNHCHSKVLGCCGDGGNRDRYGTSGRRIVSKFGQFCVLE